MNILCITGAPETALQNINNMLQLAGMAAPKKLDRQVALDLAGWHKKALGRSRDATGGSQPGRLWDQLAADLFLANIDVPLWGWSDKRSTALLQYWADFEPGVRFVLLCDTPRQALSRLILQAPSNVDVALELRNWHATHQALLSFHLRHPQRSVLLWSQEAVQKPEALLQQLRDQWSLELASPELPAGQAPEPDALVQHLAQNMFLQYPEFEPLLQELVVSVTPLSQTSPDEEQLAETDGSNPQELLNAYRVLADRSAEQQSLAAALNSHERELRQAHEQTQAVAAHNKALGQQLAQVRSEREEQTLGRQRAEAELAEAKHTLELHGQQLSQAQQELEAALARLKSHEKRLSQISQQLSVEQQGHAQVRATLEAERAATLQKQLAAEKCIAESKQQLHAEQKSCSRAQTQALQAQEESLVLQQQLQQTQEELETSFLQQCKLQDQLKTVQSSLQRVLQRNPDYCDFEMLESLSSPTDHPHEAHWRVRGLYAGSRQYPQVDFFTVLHQGSFGLGIERKVGDSSPLQHWPTDVAEGGRLILKIERDPKQLKALVAMLMELSTSDWDLLQALPKLLAAQPGTLTAEWATALQQHRLLMDRWPPALRFDTVRLVREQVNVDYEHLWLRLGDVSFGAQRWPHLEFRLACANTQEGQFGQHPKLEFPASAQSVFKGWFEESADDFGPKLELRFAMPVSMDRKVWARLPAADQQLVTALLAVLPRLLASLPAAGISTQRAIQQWQTMATNMLRVLRELTAPLRRATPPAVAVASPITAPMALETAYAKPMVQALAAASSSLATPAAAQTDPMRRPAQTKSGTQAKPSTPRKKTAPRKAKAVRA
ncbi:hypothetical protein [Azohydromonas lata]|uniref:hypothetical protein n=1 Tax=Azohydromonas lata TaxID=45677 RepID=UPI00083644F0|nr:hypothetical protein [Azohydromonas lata]